MDVFTGPRRNTHVVYSQYGAVGNEGIWDQMLVLPLPNCVLTSKHLFPPLCDGVNRAYLTGMLSGLNEIKTLKFLMQHLTYARQMVFSLVLDYQSWV